MTAEAAINPVAFLTRAGGRLIHAAEGRQSEGDMPLYDANQMHDAVTRAEERGYRRGLDASGYRWPALRNERGTSVVTVGLLAVVLVVVAGFTLVVAGVVA